MRQFTTEHRKIFFIATINLTINNLLSHNQLVEQRRRNRCQVQGRYSNERGEFYWVWYHVFLFHSNDGGQFKGDNKEAPYQGMPNTPHPHGFESEAILVPKHNIFLHQKFYNQPIYLEI